MISMLWGSNNCINSLPFPFWLCTKRSTLTSVPHKVKCIQVSQTTHQVRQLSLISIVLGLCLIKPSYWLLLMQWRRLFLFPVGINTEPLRAFHFIMFSSVYNSLATWSCDQAKMADVNNFMLCWLLCKVLQMCATGKDTIPDLILSL